MNDIQSLKDRLRQMEAAEEEPRVFEHYVEARTKYVSGLKDWVSGKLSKRELMTLYEEEMAAFDRYLKHREALKPPKPQGSTQ